MKKLLSFIMLCGTLILAGCSATTTTIGNPNNPNEQSLGSMDAPVVITEYSDYKCPHCRSFHENIFPGLKEEFIDTGRVRYVFHDYPIRLNDSWTLAQAAHCIYQQDYDTFWNVQTKLFTMDEIYSTSTIAKILEGSPINIDSFTACTESSETKELIQNKKRTAEERRVRGTPTFFIGSQMMVGLYDYDKYQKVIESELAKHSN